MALTAVERSARRLCAIVVASVAAYASYEHQRVFALRGGADRVGASLLVGLCAGLYDIGKISGFQFCDARAGGLLSRELAEDRSRIAFKDVSHDPAGMQAAPAVLHALGFGGELELDAAVTRIAEIIGGHHGRFHRFEPRVAQAAVGRGLLGGRSWARQREGHAAAVYEAVGEPIPPKAIKASAAVLITGIVILADWLVSQEKFLLAQQRRLPPLRAHFAGAVRNARRLANGRVAVFAAARWSASSISPTVLLSVVLVGWYSGCVTHGRGSSDAAGALSGEALQRPGPGVVRGCLPGLGAQFLERSLPVAELLFSLAAPAQHLVLPLDRAPDGRSEPVSLPLLDGLEAASAWR